MRNKFALALVAVATGLLASFPAAQGAIQSFTLQNTVFDDGATASGFFQFAGTWHIEVSAGDESSFSSFLYTPDNSRVLPVEDSTSISMMLGATTTHRSLHLHFDRPSTGSPSIGMLLPLITKDAGPWYASRELTDTDVRYVTGGELLVTCGAQCPSMPGVPEPAAYCFFAMGIFAMSAALIHRRRVTASLAS
jgi:hypothetical protein